MLLLYWSKHESAVSLSESRLHWQFNENAWIVVIVNFDNLPDEGQLFQINFRKKCIGNNISFHISLIKHSGDIIINVGYIEKGINWEFTPCSFEGDW